MRPIRNYQTKNTERETRYIEDREISNRIRVLVINPGGASTKIAIFSSDIKRITFPKIIKIYEETIRHPFSELSQFTNIFDQLNYRKELVEELIANKNFNCIVTRGGPLKPLKKGTYQITNKVISDIKQGKFQSMHPSLLGPLIANAIAKKREIPAFFVDPESVDEFTPLARISGLPEITRKSLSHYLNVNGVIRKAARVMRKPIKRCNFIIAHLGSGITIAANQQGKQIDANNANEDGPFAPQRTGSLPTVQLVEMCFSGKYSKQEMIDKIQRKGGLVAYLGTDDIKIIEQRIRHGDKQAKLIYDAMVYQIVKEIGSMYVVLKGNVTAIIITGGIAHSRQLIRKLKIWLSFINKPILVFPGEEEMTTLALGAIKILLKLEKKQQY